jgi:hypothetical protein
MLGCLSTIVSLLLEANLEWLELSKLACLVLFFGAGEGLFLKFFTVT